MWAPAAPRPVAIWLKPWLKLLGEPKKLVGAGWKDAEVQRVTGAA